ncbi:hypothetical protein ACVITL_006134 [Rhizobium pisi]
MFLRHDPSSLCTTTGPLLVVTISSALREMLFGRQGIFDITITEAQNLGGGVKVGLMSNFAQLYSRASRQPA